MDKSAQHRGVRRVVSTHLPTVVGVFDLIGFERAGFDRANLAKREHETALVMTLGDLQDGVPLLRIHSQCLTGEVLGSLRCDCRGQLEVAMSAIADEGSGTIEANEALGFDADCRDFSLAVAVLHELKVRQVRLMTNNPQKVEALTKGGIEVIELIACEAPASPYALSYLRTKKKKMGHSLTIM